MRKLLILAALLAGPAAADIDRTIADFRTPAEIRWVRNPAGTNERRFSTAILPSPGPMWCASSGWPGT